MVIYIREMMARGSLGGNSRKYFCSFLSIFLSDFLYLYGEEIDIRVRQLCYYF